MSARQQLDVEYDALAADAAQGPTDQQLASVAHLGVELARRAAVVAQLQAQLAQATAAWVDMREHVLPAAMEQVGLTAFKLADGSEIAVREELHTSITKENIPKAAAWLRAKGEDGILKAQVAVAFGKGEAQKATALALNLQAQGHTAILVEAVHPQTLKKWFRELRDLVLKGEKPQDMMPPDDLFGAYIRNVVDLTPPKGKK